MSIELEQYDPGKHDRRKVAELAFEADASMHSMVFGGRERAIEVLERLIREGKGWFAHRNILCAIKDDQLAGVVVCFESTHKDELDKASGMEMARALGFFAFLRKMPLLFRMRKLVWTHFDPPGTYVHTLAVSEEQRGQGVGSQVIDLLHQRFGRLYLDANMGNERALAFYERKGFQIRAANKVRMGGRTLGTYSLEKS